MSSTGFGYTAETHRKLDAKYDLDSEQQAVTWINAVLGGEELKGGGKDEMNDALKDGIILCKLMNVLSPGSVKKIHPATSGKFKLIENIANFLKAAEDYGVHRGDLFQSVYLERNQNMMAVVGGIHALGRKAQKNGYSGPALGPKEASSNRREFTEEQLLHGRVHGI